MNHCDLEVGAVIFYERFSGAEGLKDRYFIVVRNSSPVVACLTTTTRTHSETNPKLATEFCEVAKDESCLPKRCFIDLRNIYSFDDIVLGSKIRAKSVKTIGHLEEPVLLKLRGALVGSRGIAPIDKERLLQAIDAELDKLNQVP